MPSSSAEFKCCLALHPLALETTLQVLQDGSCVSSKEESKRAAVASCSVLLGQKVFNLVVSNQLAKGDALTVARIVSIKAD